MLKRLGQKYNTGYGDLGPPQIPIGQDAVQITVNFINFGIKQGWTQIVTLLFPKHMTMAQ
jgi:hypothetical protein